LAERELTGLGSLEAVADRMIAAIPNQASPWAAVVGPVYTAKSLERWLGISRQAVSQHAKARRLLRLTTADGVAVFPAFQFDDVGARLPGLKPVLDTLAGGLNDPWTWAAWLNTPGDDGVTHAARLRQGDLAVVLAEAAADADAWGAP
jgi:hypothetical protein